MHCADLHLDAPFSLRSPRQAERHRTELRSNLSTLTLLIKQQKIDLCLMSGDLFDRNEVTPETRALLEREMKNCPDCRFILAAGNHDPLTDGSPYRYFDFPENVTVLPAHRTVVHLDEIGADVYGYSFDGKNNAENPVTGWKIEDPERVNILCVHGEVDVPSSPNGPCTRADIGNSGFDYVALGHIHKGTGLQCENGVYWAYPGCLEGRGFDETGIKGVLAGTLEKGKADLSFVRVCKRHYEIVECDVGGCDRAEALHRARAAVGKAGEDAVVRLILTGEVKEGMIFLPEELVHDGWTGEDVEVRDATVLAPDFTALERDTTLKGVFYRLMKEKIDAGEATPEALKYGLMALEDRNIVDYGGTDK